MPCFEVQQRIRVHKGILNSIPDLGCKSPPRHHSPKFRVPGYNSINPAGHHSGHNYYFALFTTPTYFTRKIEYVEQLKSGKFIVPSENRKLQILEKENYKS